jgi:hypothetical protein
MLLGVCAVLGVGWLMISFGDLSLDPNAPPSPYYSYVERSKTVFEDAPARFVELGIAPIMWAYDMFGFFGAGLGTGAQGAQYFGRSTDIAGAAEGGLGKITLELGIPGLLVVGWLAILLLVRVWRIMRQASEVSARSAALSYGLFSFLIANVAGFSVATQAYGDIFILLLLSWTLGFLLAIPVLLKREIAARPVVFAGAAQQLGQSKLRPRSLG